MRIYLFILFIRYWEMTCTMVLWPFFYFDIYLSIIVFRCLVGLASQCLLPSDAPWFNLYKQNLNCMLTACTVLKETSYSAGVHAQLILCKYLKFIYVMHINLLIYSFMLFSPCNTCVMGSSIWNTNSYPKRPNRPRPK